MQVKDLLKKEKAMDLMTPFGYIVLSEEDVKKMNRGEEVKIIARPTHIDKGMQIDDVNDFLNLKLGKGGYVEDKNTYSYIADFDVKQKN